MIPNNGLPETEGPSPAFLVLTALTALVLGILLLAVALRAFRSAPSSPLGHTATLAARLKTAGHQPAAMRGQSTFVYIVGSAEDASRLLRVLSEWTGSANVSLRSEPDRQVIVVQTAADVIDGRLFDFAFLEHDDAGAGVSVVDLRLPAR